MSVLTALFGVSNTVSDTTDFPYLVHSKGKILTEAITVPGPELCCHSKLPISFVLCVALNFSHNLRKSDRLQKRLRNER